MNARSVNGRLVLTVALAIYGAAYIRNPGAGRLLDGVDLAIHETGHLVFGLFGEFISIAGGTLFQLMLPAAFVVYFWRRGDRHAGSVALWWVAQNFWHISVYAADARRQELELVGGGEHDWFLMLAELDLLNSDRSIARGIWLIGVATYLVATWIGLATARAPVRQRTSAVESA
jgi:hypothetical protein